MTSPSIRKANAHIISNTITHDAVHSANQTTLLTHISGDMDAANVLLNDINTTLTAGGVVDISTLSTHAKQDTINTTLGTILTKNTEIEESLNMIISKLTGGDQRSKNYSNGFISMVNWVINNTLTGSGVITPKLDNKSGYEWSFLFSATDHPHFSVFVEESLDNVNWYATGSNLNTGRIQHFIKPISISSPYFRFNIALLSGGNQEISIKYVKTDN